METRLTRLHRHARSLVSQLKYNQRESFIFSVYIQQLNKAQYSVDIKEFLSEDIFSDLSLHLQKAFFVQSNLIVTSSIIHQI